MDCCGRGPHFNAPGKPAASSAAVCAVRTVRRGAPPDRATSGRPRTPLRCLYANEHNVAKAAYNIQSLCKSTATVVFDTRSASKVRYGHIARPTNESPARRAAGGRVAALAIETRIDRYAAGPSALRVGQHFESRLLSDLLHRLAVIRDGKRRLGRDRRRRQRGNRRYLAVYGRRVHAQPCGGAKRRPGLSAESAGPERRVQSRRSRTCCCAIPRR